MYKVSLLRQVNIDNLIGKVFTRLLLCIVAVHNICSMEFLMCHIYIWYYKFGSSCQLPLNYSLEFFEILYGFALNGDVHENILGMGDDCT